MGRQTYLAVAKSNSAADLHVLKMKDKHSVGDAPPSDVTDKAGATALHIACRVGNLDMVQWLVELELNLEAKAHNGATAAHDAAATGHLVCLQCLLYHKPRLINSTLNLNGVLPIHLAAMYATRCLGLRVGGGSRSRGLVMREPARVVCDSPPPHPHAAAHTRRRTPRRGW